MITSPVPILFMKMFIQADNYFDILIHCKLIIIWCTQQTEKWDDTRHRQSRSKPEPKTLFCPSLSVLKLHRASLVTGLAIWGGLQSGSDGLSLTSGGREAALQTVSQPPGLKLSH